MKAGIAIRIGVATCLAALGIGVQAAEPARVDLLIRNATIYDGSGGRPFKGDIAVSKRRVVAISAKLDNTRADQVVDARGLAAAPGFINTLSHAGDALIHDGRALSDIKQGITLELMGEGESYGPMSPAMRKEWLKRQGDIRYDITWNTLGEFLDFLTKKGVSVNVASFVGAGNVRVHEQGYVDRPPTAKRRACRTRFAGSRACPRRTGSCVTAAAWMRGATRTS